MKIRCEKKNILKAVFNVYKAIASKTTLPVLSGIYLECRDDGKVRLFASDTQLSVETFFDAATEGSGATVIPGRNLYDVLRSMPGEIVELATNNDVTMITLKSGITEFNYNLMNAEEFPLLSTVPEGNSFVLPADVLKDIVRQTSISVSTQDMRPVFTGIQMIFTEDQATFVATDTHRLSVRYEKMNCGEAAGQNIVVPVRPLTEALRIVNDEDMLKITFDRKQLAIKCGDTTITGRLIDGQMIDYKRLLPQDFTASFSVRRDDIVESLERLLLVAREGSSTIRLDVDKDVMLMEANTPGIGKAADSIRVDNKGEAIKIAFNCNYLLDGIRSCGTENICFRMNDPVSPVLINPVEGADFTYLLLPVRISS